MKKMLVTAVIALLGGFSIGYFVFNDSSLSNPIETGRSAPARIVEDRQLTESGTEQFNTNGNSQGHYQGVADVLAEPTGFPQYYALYQLANSTSIEGLPQLLQQSLALEDNFLRGGFATVFIERFVYLDPPAALRFAQSQVASTMSRNIFLIQTVYREWIRRDQVAAIASLDSLEDPLLKQAMLVYLVQSSVQLSAESRASLESQLSSDGQQVVDRARMQRLPAAQAFTEALQVQGSRERLNALSMALARWVTDDPFAAMEHLQALSSSGELDKTVLTQLEIAGLNVWARKNFDDAYAYAEISPQRSRLVSSLLQYLVGENPQRAVQMAQNYQRDYGKADRMMNRTLILWAQRDIDAVISYVERQNIQVDAMTETNFATEYAKQSPQRALEWAKGRGLGVEAAVTNAVGYRNPQLAEQFAATLEAGSMKSSLLLAVANFKAKENPQAALQWLDKNMAVDDQYYESAKGNIVQQWIFSNPSEAAMYLSNTSETMRQSMTTSLVSSWYGKDQYGLRAWIENLNSPEQQDVAWLSYAGATAIIDNNFEQALSIAELIHDADKRRSAEISFVQQWAAKQPERKNELMERYGIDEKDLQQMPAYFSD